MLQRVCLVGPPYDEVSEVYKTDVVGEIGASNANLLVPVCVRALQAVGHSIPFEWAKSCVEGGQVSVGFVDAELVRRVQSVL